METLPIAFLLLYNLLLLAGALQAKEAKDTRIAPYVILFFGSGMPALIYQIVWQRMLFAIYGVNSESVAVVVAAFLGGLGLGSLVGSWLSARYPRKAIWLFATAELATAMFGLASSRVFAWAATHTAGAPLGYVIPLSLGLLLVPTICMGATLPLLADFLVRRSGAVGRSVGLLYFANTFGSATACYLCALFLLRDFGQSGSIRVAASMNLCVGAAVLFLARSSVEKRENLTAPRGSENGSFSLATIALLSALSAFVSLGFEIVWFRIFVIASISRAPAFALLLSTLLGGIAAGSYVAGQYSEKVRATQVASIVAGAFFVAGGLSPFLPPLVAFLRFRGVNYLLGGIAFFLIAAFMGAIFPLLCKLGVADDKSAGRAIGLIYAANIAGAVCGSLIVGFVLMDRMGMRGLSALLSGLSIALGAGIVFRLQKRRSTKMSKLLFAAAAAASLVAQTCYSNFAARLTFGPSAGLANAIAHFVENRSGTIAVTSEGAVFGDGVYDGFYNTDALDDKNLIVRAYAVGSFHPAPRRILMIGLSSGSWAQILVNHPAAESLDIVEINRGYLNLINKYPAVRSILTNRKARIVVDDGRRWLLANPDQKYDLIVQNTSFYWRDHSAQLLSTDYLRIIRAHLSLGGIYYYNTTGSDDVVATGLSVFSHGLRVVNFLAVSDSPISVDVQRWMSVLRAYKVDEKQVFDETRPEAVAAMEKYRTLADSVNQKQIPFGMESEVSMRQRIKHGLIFTDDNMGWEWRDRSP